ncbi:MAG: hypothetical protein U0527_13520 [Candidatus Eisenbacteria bacterium]
MTAGQNNNHGLALLGFGAARSCLPPGRRDGASCWNGCTSRFASWCRTCPREPRRARVAGGLRRAVGQEKATAALALEGGAYACLAAGYRGRPR